jgi:indoleamine 2,3-dioxygenase
MLSHFLDLPRPDLATGILEGSPDTTTLNAHDWDVDPLTAFMPSKPPLARLPLPWEPWEVIFDDARSIKLALADGDSPPLKREESSRWRDALSVVSSLQFPMTLV